MSECQTCNVYPNETVCTVCGRDWSPMQAHVYDGGEHKQPGPIESCLKCRIDTLEAGLRQLQGTRYTLPAGVLLCRALLEKGSTR